MIDQQLGTIAEKISERRLTVRSIENIILLHPHPRQLAALLSQLIVLTRQLFFFRQKRSACFDPLFIGNDFVLCHGYLQT